MKQKLVEILAIEDVIPLSLHFTINTSKMSNEIQYINKASSKKSINNFQTNIYVRINKFYKPICRLFDEP